MRNSRGQFVKGTIPTNAFKKGTPPWNKGLKTPDEVREKQSQAKLRTPTKYWLGKQRSHMRGEKNWNWKGGTYGTERHADMGRVEYIEWRRKVFERDDYTCQTCGKRGVELNADHIKPWSTHPKLRYELSNGRTLCISCHREVTRKQLKQIWSNQSTALPDKV